MEAESLLFGLMLSIFGNPFNLGVFLFVIFMTFMIFLRMGSEAMLICMIPCFVLMFAFIPQLKLVTGIGLGLMFGIAIVKFIRS